MKRMSRVNTDTPKNEHDPFFWDPFFLTCVVLPHRICVTSVMSRSWLAIWKNTQLSLCNSGTVGCIFERERNSSGNAREAEISDQINNSVSFKLMRSLFLFVFFFWDALAEFLLWHSLARSSRLSLFFAREHKKSKLGCPYLIENHEYWSCFSPYPVSVWVFNLWSISI